MKRKISLIIPITVILNASISSAQLTVGILAGPQFATRNYNNELGVRATFNTTLNAGLTAFIPLGKELYLHETIGYSGKGVLGKNVQFTDNVGNDVGTGDVHVLIHYLELRTPIVYYTSISSKIDLSTGAGPYFGYALGGYRKITGDNIYTVYGEQKYDIDFEQDGHRRFDFGVIAEVNFLLSKKWLLGLSGDFGLLKAEETQVRAIRNTSFTISFGYLFKKRNAKNKK